MPILVCGAEGEWALFENSLVSKGADDKRRGSVLLGDGDQMFKDFSFGSSADMWFHFRISGENVDSNVPNGKNFIRIGDASGTDMVVFDPTPLDTVSFWGFQFKTAASNGGALDGASEELLQNENDFDDFDVRIRISTATDPNDTMTVNGYKNNQLRYTRVVVDSGGWNLPAQIRISEKDTQISHVFS